MSGSKGEKPEDEPWNEVPPEFQVDIDGKIPEVRAKGKRLRQLADEMFLHGRINAAMHKRLTEILPPLPEKPKDDPEIPW